MANALDLLLAVGIFIVGKSYIDSGKLDGILSGIGGLGGGSAPAAADDSGGAAPAADDSAAPADDSSTKSKSKSKSKTDTTSTDSGSTDTGDGSTAPADSSSTDTSSTSTKKKSTSKKKKKSGYAWYNSYAGYVYMPEQLDPALKHMLTAYQNQANQRIKDSAYTWSVSNSV